jgi:hypothetical protein
VIVDRHDITFLLRGPRPGDTHRGGTLDGA